MLYTECTQPIEESTELLFMQVCRWELRNKDGCPITNVGHDGGGEIAHTPSTGVHPIR